MTVTRRIVAMGGGGFSMEPDNPRLDNFILTFGREHAERPRVCFVSTASGDNPDYVRRFYDAFRPRACEPSHLDLFRPGSWTSEPREALLTSDILYFSGGSTFNALTLWRAWHLTEVLREAYESGTVFAGLSAGAACWFNACLTDSTGRKGAVLEGLGWLPGSFCPHYDSETHRRPLYRQAVRGGALEAGFAADDSAALVFENETLVEVVTSRPEAQAFRVQEQGGDVSEQTLSARFLS